MSFSLTPEAERDLEEAFAYYLEHGGKKVAERFLDDTGHCIDFHRLDSTLQLEQLAFALKCSVKEAVHK